MKKLLFLYLFFKITQSWQNEDEGFLKDIKNLALKEDNILTKKMTSLTHHIPKKQKTRILINLLKSASGEKTPRTNSPRFTEIKKKIQQSPHLHRKFRKMVKIYKKLTKTKKRKLLENLYHGIHNSMNSITSLMDYLICHFAGNNNLIDTYLKPLSTLYALNGVRKNLKNKEDFRLKKNFYGNLEERFKVMKDMLKSDLEDIQKSVLELDRVTKKIEHMRSGFNFRLDMKIDILRDPLLRRG